MIKQITETFRIKTEPLNWNVQKFTGGQWKDDAFFDRMNQAKDYIMHQEGNDLIKHSIFDKFREIVAELGLAETDELSAWHLTRIVKHPDFIRKRSLKSLGNLKSRIHRPLETKEPQNEPSITLEAQN